jgi:DNA-binding transcriptional regulator YiaG
MPASVPDSLVASLFVSGAKLRKIREGLGMTRKEFARALGIGRNLVKEYEEAPKVRRTIALAAKALRSGLNDR